MTDSGGKSEEEKELKKQVEEEHNEIKETQIRKSNKEENENCRSTKEEIMEAFEKNKSYIWDCHCHLHDDLQRLDDINKLSLHKVALMGVSFEKDWQTVQNLYFSSPQKIVPCFGQHPWFAHLIDLTSGITKQKTKKNKQTNKNKKSQYG